MLGVGTYNPHNPSTPDYLALVAHLLNGCRYFHRFLPVALTLGPVEHLF